MDQPSGTDQQQPKWKPLSATDRRVVGVLVEKAKTTPEQYPLTLNSVRTGCNQKSNRFPTMQLEPEQIEDSLERLRHLGAVIEIQDSGRVAKYRHRMYEWLGVDKVELAVMAELLLRGAQTLGELRGRAARMEPIADINELRPLLASLAAKGLIVYLTPEGRGCVVTHALYSQSELDRLKQEYAGRRPTGDDDEDDEQDDDRSGTESIRHAAHRATPAPLQSGGSAVAGEVGALRQEVAECRLRIDELEQLCARMEENLNELRQQLGA